MARQPTLYTANLIDSDTQHGASPDGHEREANDFEAPPPRRSAMTGIDSTPIIQKFLRNEYHREHWEACAKRAQSLIEKKFKNLRDANDEEIQAWVTCRAKTKKSLEEKLKMRNMERRLNGVKEYETNSDILDDVKDLAGVRVVLYTPNSAQRNRVREIVKDIWAPHFEEKAHGERFPSATAGANGTKDGVYVRRHLGYQAEHYRALMKESHGNSKYDWTRGDQVEIQVVSALGHAWAEAGHDTMYKTSAYGRPTMEEHRILDALSGLIVSGDLLLEQFSESVTRRTVAKWKQFEQFVMFLQDSDVLEREGEVKEADSPTTYSDDFSAEGKDVLYRFLVQIDKNYPLAVRNTLRDIGYPENPASGLREETKCYYPELEPPHGLLTPFCVISKLLPKFEPTKEPIEESTLEDPNVTWKCGTMMDALILLQTFAGSPQVAKKFLLQLEMTELETESLNFVLSNPNRRTCLGSAGATPPKPWIISTLQTAWIWFEKQTKDSRSLCGLFFRLATMGVPARVINNRERLKKLTINSLSRLNTPEDS
jgi:ppGpp synthetase/RelA/SpoT-type nucleotidyltranferase